jgi:hypothetical protein
LARFEVENLKLGTPKRKKGNHRNCEEKRKIGTRNGRKETRKDGKSETKKENMEANHTGFTPDYSQFYHPSCELVQY